MAKRPLGLGKSKNQKKQKVSNKDDGSKKELSQSPEDIAATSSEANQIEIALDEDEDADDELVQLKGLWNTFLKDKDNQLLLNGVVHECDRLLREQENDNAVVLSDVFHSIYAQALSELTVFLGEENDDDEKKYKSMDEFFEAAQERCNTGLAKHSESSLLPLTQSKIIFQRIPLQYISQLNLLDQNDEKYKLYELLEQGKKSYTLAPGYPQLAFDVLSSFYDLLDIIETFEDKDELEDGLDSDDEGDERVEVVLHENHPLKKIKNNMDQNYEWLKKNLLSLLEDVSSANEGQAASDAEKKDSTTELYKSVASTLGQLYLNLAEEPSKTFAELMYDSDDEEQTDKKALKEAKKAQKEAIPLLKHAVKYLEEAQVEDEPQTWVDVAEAIIDLGNLYEFESKEQEDAYQKAEAILRKANKATHGTYQVILDNLLNKE
ncbi:unnamed protein product [Kluyveromyces dobzhanskii CBS 2104]|uniref:Enhancer of translation termination 1 n=1 Tax=Kluyveromyces dobzhanskii CBS 2104 TaxID=1427455 RepID=A0A0A8L7S5_9SACH|nr:unnamed protein product [Kluyveromyces dobzhanskii CBS 2104]